MRNKFFRLFWVFLEGGSFLLGYYLKPCGQPRTGFVDAEIHHCFQSWRQNQDTFPESPAESTKLIAATPVTMMAGFGFGIAATPPSVKSLKTLIIPLTFLMVYPMMVTLNFKNLKDGIRNVRLQLSTSLFNFGLIPFLVFGPGGIFFADDLQLVFNQILFIVFVAMTLMARTVADHPETLLYIALVYGTVMRNLSIVPAITTFGEKAADTVLVIAAA